MRDARDEGEGAEGFSFRDLRRCLASLLIASGADIKQFPLPLTAVSAMYNMLQAGVASAAKVFKPLDAPEQTAETPIVLPLPNGQSRSGRVEFCHVDFSSVMTTAPSVAGEKQLVTIARALFAHCVQEFRALGSHADRADIARDSPANKTHAPTSHTWAKPPRTDDPAVPRAEAIPPMERYRSPRDHDWWPRV